MATRGLSVIEFNHCPLWWHGPSWLGSNHIFWPVWNLPEIISENLEEIRNSKSSAEVTMVAGVDEKMCFSLGWMSHVIHLCGDCYEFQFMSSNLLR